MSDIKRVFVANRGEIAVRIIKACHAMGLEAVLGVSEADRDTLGARMADRAVCLGPAAASQSYLRAETVVAAALGTGCQALHPGYGFLSERSALQRMCAEEGLTFIGPSADAIEAMGDKLSAIRIAREAGVPVIPGTGRLETLAEAEAAAEEIGFPCLIKASAGGGGRGMRVARTKAELKDGFASARAEAGSAFGDSTVYLERFIERAKHIEIQILADTHGNVCHLFERDCSVQRRHQKLIEEAPSPALSAGRRDEMTEAAVSLARRSHYTNAGTVEFVYDMDRDEFFFLEMNSRIQVEHPVTELVTGIDIVQEQIRIAAGEPLSFRQDDVRLRGHAIECRVNAESATRGFLPSPGRIARWQPPEGAHTRLDTHCCEGYLVPPYYDSMIAKLIVWGEDRAAAIAGMSAALDGFAIEGIETTIPFHRAVMDTPAFAGSHVTTRWVETDFMPSWTPAPHSGE